MGKRGKGLEEALLAGPDRAQALQRPEGPASDCDFLTKLCKNYTFSCFVSLFFSGGGGHGKNRGGARRGSL